MIRASLVYIVALGWVLCYVALGWPGVLLVAGLCLAGDAVLFRVSRLQADADRATALDRLEGYERG